MTAQAINEGAKPLTGGKAPGAPEDGYYYSPTILDDVEHNSIAGQNEIFGPVLSVLEYDSFDQAMTMLNGTEFGLTSALFSNRNDLIQRFLNESQNGMIHVNHGTVPDNNMPFGGVRTPAWVPIRLGLQRSTSTRPNIRLTSLGKLSFDRPITIASIDVFPIRAQGGVSPRMALGTMPTRPALLVRVEDTQGCFGWGEVWANFPPRANIHKAHIIEDVVAGHLKSLSFTDPARSGRGYAMPYPYSSCMSGRKRFSNTFWRVSTLRFGTLRCAAWASHLRPLWALTHKQTPMRRPSMLKT